MLALRRRISRGIVTSGEFVFVGLWLVIVVVLVRDLVGITRRGTGFRVQTAGFLVMNTAQVVNMLAHLHSRGYYFPVVFVGFAVFVGGLFVSSREDRVARG